MKRKLALVKSSSPPANGGVKGLLAEVREMILATRQTVAQGVNAALVILHWQIDQRIRKDILKEKRADYGEKIVATLSRQLNAELVPGSRCGATGARAVGENEGKRVSGEPPRCDGCALQKAR